MKPNLLEKLFLYFISALILSVGTILFISYLITAFCSSERWNIVFQKTINLIQYLHTNWIVLLFVLVPLFYHPLYTFLKEATELPFGAKRRPKQIEEETTKKKPEELEQ
jgi:hypothetical protein